MDVVEFVPCSTMISQVTSFFASGAMANVLTAASDTGALRGAARRWHAADSVGGQSCAGCAAAAPGLPPVTAADSPTGPCDTTPLQALRRTSAMPPCLPAPASCFPTQACWSASHSSARCPPPATTASIPYRYGFAPPRAFSGAWRTFSCPVVGWVLSTSSTAERCLALCATLLQGNTTACRQLHVTAARLLPLIHCQHVGPDSMKCLQDECR